MNQVTHAWLAHLLLFVAVSGQESAQFWADGDNYLTVAVAYNGVDYTDIGGRTGLGQIHHQVLSDITSSTKLRFTCVNAGGPGGFIASIEYGGEYFSTNGDVQNYGYYALTSASSNLDTTVSPPGSIWNSGLEGSPYNARWTWTCGKNNDWSACTGSETEIYVFAFSNNYQVVLSQPDSRVDLFDNNVRSTWLENEDDPSAMTFTNIGNLDPADYIDGEGYYTFKMVYINLDESTVTLEWKQTSWLTASGITGYVPINVPGQDPFFAGLGKSHADGQGLMDGTAGGGTWWNNAGTIGGWSNTGTPGFNQQTAYSTTLYAARTLVPTDEPTAARLPPRLPPQLLPQLPPRLPPQLPDQPTVMDRQLRRLIGTN